MEGETTPENWVQRKTRKSKKISFYPPHIQLRRKMCIDFGLFRPKSTRRSLKFLRAEQKSDPEDPEDYSVQRKTRVVSPLGRISCILCRLSNLLVTVEFAYT